MRRVRFAFVLLPMVAGPALAVVSEAPSNPGAVSDLERAAIYVEEARYQSARDLLQPLVQREPMNADAWSLLGFALRKSGEIDAGLGAYGRALALDPLHRGANEYLGELWLERGEIARAKLRLTILELACPSGCEERADLEAAIQSFQPSGTRP